MARKVTVFQTLKDKANPDVIHRDGPFICRWENSWLGDGYYFWETFLQNAHWWGKSHLKGTYVICEAEFLLDDEKIFDLAGGNTQHFLDFENYIAELRQQGHLKDKITTVSRVFHFIKKRIPSFQYEATRAYSMNSINEKLFPEYIHKIFFEKDKPSFMSSKPLIQICFYKKTSLGLKNYSIIYPEQYVEQGVF